MIRKVIACIAFIASVIGCALSLSPQVSAIDPSGFDPGRIIDDAVFYDPGGMGSVAEIQRFLNAHVPSCDTQGTRASGYGNLTNAQYAQQIKGWPGPPYACLNNYHENPSTGETSFEKGGGAFSGGQSSAQIIYNAAQTHGINPKVLLVLLRKESLNLFSDSWPMKSQYKYAMGYACPDSGPGYSANCDTSKSGFYKQINYAAWQLRYYHDHMGSYNYAPGRWNTIQYSPNPSCGTKNVYIQNYATASLYIYTPYVPNDAALRAYPGEAPCGAYGNRNFWFFWQEWFGSTYLKFTNLEEPRWMVAKKDTYKIDAATSQRVGDVIRKGTQLYFPTKIVLDNGVFVRTAYDTSAGYTAGVPLEDLMEIEYESMETSRWLSLKSTSQKQIPRSGIKLGEAIPKDRQIYFTSKIVINGQTFLRSLEDTTFDSNKGIPLENLLDVVYEPFLEPRWMQVKNDTYNKNVQTGANIESMLHSGTDIFFSSKIYVDGKWYMRTQGDTNLNKQTGVLATDLIETPYVSIETPRMMQLKSRQQKVDPATGRPTGLWLDKGTQLFFSTKVYINGQWYLRTAHDTTYDVRNGVPGGEVEDIPYVELETPRMMQLKSRQQKVDPATGRPTGLWLDKGTQLFFSTKVYINGQWYLRTAHDTTYDVRNGVPIEHLVDMPK